MIEREERAKRETGHYGSNLGDKMEQPEQLIAHFPTSTTAERQRQKRLLNGGITQMMGHLLRVVEEGKRSFQAAERR